MSVSWNNFLESPLHRFENTFDPDGGSWGGGENLHFGIFPVICNNVTPNPTQQYYTGRYS